MGANLTPLPSPSKLAEIVTNVTQTMLGIRFVPDSASHPDPLRWRTAVLPIRGQRPITVGLSSDEGGCMDLCAAMFACARAAVDPSMIDDSLRELVNMTAGLIKSTLSLDQALGLPAIHHGHGPGAMPAIVHGVVLKADRLGLYLWVREGAEG